MDKPKRVIASVIWPLAMLLGAAHAASFDTRIKSPPAAVPEQIEARLKAHFDTFDRDRQKGPTAFLRNKAAHAQWSDLYYSVTLTMDEGKRLRNMDAYGLIANTDGTYTVDLKKFPQWAPLDTRLDVLTDPDVLEGYEPILKARGFRDSDLAAMRDYLATHDNQQLTLPDSKQLADSFAQRIHQRDAAGLPTDLEEARAFRYQLAKVRFEGNRQWALGLLDTLDNQRQRILASFFEEFSSGKRMFGVPSEPLEKRLEQDVERIRSGAYLQLIADEQAQINKNVAERMQKLNGGQPK
jgi:hypothetical protein